MSGGGVEIKYGKHLKVDCIVLFYKVIFLWGFLVFIPARLAQFQLNFRLGLSRVSERGVYPWCNRVCGGGGTAKSISLLSEF